jgi:SAM-dependent methyltransferase
MKTYATFGLARSFWQVVYSIRSRGEAERNMSLLFESVKHHEGWIEQALGKPLNDLMILEIGLGQGMERARYFGIRNQVVGMDLDVIPKGLDLAGYLKLIRTNGFGRFIKTVGRKLIVAGPNRSGWAKAVGEKRFNDPAIFYGDVCETIPAESTFDVVMSWSVFEHLADPEAALSNMIRALKPGGVIFISIHLYTSNNGHHDIRAFSGQEDKLPPWGHLLESARDQINPSAYLNEWRLDQWRWLFEQKTPGFREVLDSKGGSYTSRMTEALRERLKQYNDEELYTVDAIYIWKKPGA